MGSFITFIGCPTKKIYIIVAIVMNLVIVRLLYLNADQPLTITDNNTLIALLLPLVPAVGNGTEVTCKESGFTRYFVKPQSEGAQRVHGSCSNCTFCLREDRQRWDVDYTGSFDCLFRVLNTLLTSMRKRKVPLSSVHSRDNVGAAGYVTLPSATWDARPHGTVLERVNSSYFDWIANQSEVMSLKLSWSSVIGRVWSPDAMGSPTNVRAQQHLPLPSHKQHHLHIHIIGDARVTNQGKVATAHMDIIPKSCSSSGIRIGDIFNIPYHEEVFSMATVYGNAYYHSMVEAMSRLAPFVHFLRTHPNVVIQTHSKTPRIIADLLKVLDLQNQVVEGAVFAKFLYLPPGGGCGWIDPLSAWSLQAHYQQYIHKNHSPFELCKSSVLLIKRSHRRWLSQNKVIKQYLETAAKSKHLEFYEFSDTNIPALDVTMTVFHTARLIVAPHGAGLSNILFTAPGATIIEVACYGIKNGCFASLAQKLGHGFFGMVSKQSGNTTSQSCGAMEVDLIYLYSVIDKALDSVNHTHCT